MGRACQGESDNILDNLPESLILIDFHIGNFETVRFVCRAIAVVALRGTGMDNAIMRYVKRKYNLLIGQRTAEAIKIQIGSTQASRPVQENVIVRRGIGNRGPLGRFRVAKGGAFSV